MGQDNGPGAAVGILGPGLTTVPMFMRQPDGPPIAIMFVMPVFSVAPSA